MQKNYSRILPESEGNVLCVAIGERVTLEDYQTIFGEAAARIFPEHEHVRIVLHYTKPFQGWDLDAAEMDFGLLASIGNRILKVALVDPPEPVLRRWRTVKSIVGEVKVFENSEYQEALTWAKA